MSTKKYLVLLAFSFFLTEARAQGFDRNLMPKPGPAPVVSLKDPTIFNLPNGITLLVVEDHRLPKVSANFIIDAGPITEGSKSGVMGLMGGMLNEGTVKMTKADFDDSVDKIGASVRLGASGGSASALTRYFTKAFTLMSTALRQPAFPQESFDKLKTQAITALKAAEKSSASISARVTNALAYGKNHPEGEFETQQGLQALTLQDVKSAYANYITPSRSYLTIVGDITPAAAKALTLENLGTWTGHSLILPKLTMVANPTKTEIDVIDVPTAVQSEIKLVNLVDLKKSNPDYFPALLAEYILGGGAQSHLFMNLREKHGFTYGAYSSLGSGRFQSSFMASASVRTAKTDSAVTEFIKEIQRIRTEKVTEEELKNAKALYNGSFALGLEDPARTATFASTILINKLPADFYKTYLQRFNAVTADDIMRVAKKYMQEESRIVVVGNASQILEGIKKLGFPVHLYDAYASPVGQPENSSKAVKISGVDLIKGYIDAIGGSNELKKIMSYQSVMSMDMKGMTMAVDQKKMAPNKEYMTISMGGNVVMKTVFDGAKGYQMQMGNKKDLSEQEVAQKKVFTSLTEQLDYLTNPAFKLEVKPVQKINGADAYPIMVTDPTGKVSTEYYDMKSHLLVRNENTTLVNTVSATTTIDFSDYKSVGSVKFPYKQAFTVSAGGQEQNFTMTVTELKLNTGVKADDFN